MAGNGVSRSIRALLVSTFTCALTILVGVGAGSSIAASSAASSTAVTAQVPVTFVGDMSGIVGYVGTDVLRGMNVAIKEATRQKTLPGKKIKLSVLDTGSSLSIGTAKMSQAVKSDSVAVFGPVLSAEALAFAPLAQQNKVVYFGMSEAPNLVDIGNYVFRLHPSNVHVLPLLYSFLAKNGIKSVSIVYASDNPALTSQAQAMNSQFAELGIDVKQSIGIPSSTADFSSVATKLKSDNPGAIALWTSGASISSLAIALRSSGYGGTLFTDSSATPAVLSSGGSATDGMLYTVPYNPLMSYKSSKAFTRLFQSTYPGTLPSLYAAIGYDEMKAFITAIKGARGKVTRAAVLSGLTKLTHSKSFVGASGPEIFIPPTYRDVAVPGAVVQYRQGRETPVDRGRIGLVDQRLVKS